MIDNRRIECIACLYLPAGDQHEHEAEIGEELQLEGPGDDGLEAEPLQAGA